MTEVLEPYASFKSMDLARQLQMGVLESRDILKQRHFLGVLARYGAQMSLAEATLRIEKGQRDHITSGVQHFAVVNLKGDVCGSASVYPNLPLRQLMCPLPPRLAVGRLATAIPGLSKNIAAWTTTHSSTLLAPAYASLRAKIIQPQLCEPGQKLDDVAWTIEPVASPDYVQQALREAGLCVVATGRFDDCESGSKVSPVANLYVATTRHFPLPENVRL